MNVNSLLLLSHVHMGLPRGRAYGTILPRSGKPDRAGAVRITVQDNTSQSRHLGAWLESHTPYPKPVAKPVSAQESQCVTLCTAAWHPSNHQRAARPVVGVWGGGEVSPTGSINCLLLLCQASRSEGSWLVSCKFVSCKLTATGGRPRLLLLARVPVVTKLGLC